MTLAAEWLAAVGVVPEPLTETPEHAHHATLVRTHLAHGAPVVRWLPTPPEGLGTLGDRLQLLDVHTCAGPAPYVGDPFVYAWRVAVDDHGGYVAGPARIEYLQPDPTVLGGHPTVGPRVPAEHGAATVHVVHPTPKEPR